MWALAVAAAVSTGCPPTLPTSNDDHISWYRKLHGSGAPTRLFPGGHETTHSPGFAASLEGKFRKLWTDRESGALDSTTAWELMLNVAQMQIVKNFTASGWGTAQMPAELHSRVRAAYDEGKPRSEGAVPGYITGDRRMIPIPGPLRQELAAAIKPLLAAWAGLDPDELQMTSIYGVREYHRGSTLGWHVDSVGTHVLSAIYHVAAENLDEDWLAGAFPDFAGEEVGYAMKEGELFLYESAKLPHGRKGELKGDTYASIFVHFKPKGWDLDNVDRVYSLDPRWLGRAPPPPGTRAEL